MKKAYKNTIKLVFLLVFLQKSTLFAEPEGGASIPTSADLVRTALSEAQAAIKATDEANIAVAKALEFVKKAGSDNVVFESKGSLEYMTKLLGNADENKQIASGFEDLKKYVEKLPGANSSSGTTSGTGTLNGTVTLAQADAPSAQNVAPATSEKLAPVSSPANKKVIDFGPAKVSVEVVVTEVSNLEAAIKDTKQALIPVSETIKKVVKVCNEAGGNVVLGEGSRDDGAGFSKALADFEAIFVKAQKKIDELKEVFGKVIKAPSDAQLRQSVLQTCFDADGLGIDLKVGLNSLSSMANKLASVWAAELGFTEGRITYGGVVKCAKMEKESQDFQVELKRLLQVAADASAVYDKAKAAYEASASSYNTLKADSDKAIGSGKGLQDTYDSATAELKKAQDAVSDAQKTVNGLNSTIANSKNKTIRQNAQTSLKAANTKLSEAKANVRTAQNKADDAKRALDNAKPTQDTKKVAALDAAKASQDKAKAALDEAKVELDKAKAPADAAKAKDDKEKAEIKKLKDANDAAIAGTTEGKNVTAAVKEKVIVVKEKILGLATAIEDARSKIEVALR